MTQIVDKKLELMCDCCKSHFDKPCAWLSLGNEYCTEIMEIQKELEKLKEENKKLYESIEKAICYLANCDWNNKEFYDLYNILQGEDKE